MLLLPVNAAALEVTKEVAFVRRPRPVIDEDEEEVPLLVEVEEEEEVRLGRRSRRDWRWFIGWGAGGC